jgi:hypothetical protein
MGKYLTTARHHFQELESLRKRGGSYDRDARYHHSELSRLYLAASHSAGGRAEHEAIRPLAELANTWADEMKNRQEQEGDWLGSARA